MVRTGPVEIAEAGLVSGGGRDLVPLARAVRVRTGSGPLGSHVDRLSHPMMPKELHQWVRDRYGDRAAYWPEDVDLRTPPRAGPAKG